MSKNPRVSKAIEIGLAVGHQEGWDVFRVQGNRWMVQKDDDSELLATDDLALTRARAAGILVNDAGYLVDERGQVLVDQSANSGKHTLKVHVTVRFTLDLDPEEVPNYEDLFVESADGLSFAVHNDEEIVCVSAGCDAYETLSVELVKEENNDRPVERGRRP